MAHVTIGMVGEGVATTKSPEIYNDWFAQAGLGVRMVRHEVPRGALPGFVVQARRDPAMRGFVVTAPHKADIVPLLAEWRPEVSTLRVANAVRKGASGRLVGGMFDGDAFTAVLAAAGVSSAGKTVAIVGAGAAGLACAWSALAAGADQVRLVDHIAASADAAAARLGKAFPHARVEAGPPIRADIWINATPVGADADDPPPIAPEHFEGALLVLDLSAGASGSRLLAFARAAGARTVDGRAFAQAQFAPIRHFILGDEHG